jgi:hypothetical protein
MKIHLLRSYYSDLQQVQRYSACGEESLLRDSSLIQFSRSKEMAEFNSTGHGLKEPTAPDAGTQQPAEDPTPASAPWGAESAPPPPLIDGQRNTVSFTAVWAA